MKKFAIGAGLIVALLVAGAFYLKWVNVSTATTSGQSGVTLSVNKDKAAEDIRDAKEAAKETYQKAKEAVGEAAGKAKDAIAQGTAAAKGVHTVSGTLSAVEGNTLTVLGTDGKPVELTLAADAKLTKGDAAIDAKGLTAGQAVTVTYEAKDTGNVATSVKVTDKVEK
jgi:uncharacterized lipoprotein NlpE involved in copper resistance